MAKLFDLTGRIALLTGASKGMGLAMATGLASHGAMVVISSRKQDQLDAAAEGINREVGAERAIGIACNVGYKDQLRALVEATRSRVGAIDIVVGNAGVNPFYGKTSEIPDDAYEKTMRANVQSNLWLAQLAVPDMVEKGLMLGTALAPVIGYDKAAGLAKDHIIENFDFDRAYDEITIARLAEDARRAWYRSRDESSGQGTLLHTYAEKFTLHAMSPSEHPEPAFPRNKVARGSAEKFRSFWDAHSIKPIEPEFRCLSLRHWYAGTSDLDCTMDGKRTMIDFKTSKSIKPSFGRQLAAYCRARKEELDVHYEKRVIALFPRVSGDFEVAEFDDFDDDWQKFMGARIQYRMHKESTWKKWKSSPNASVQRLASYMAEYGGRRHA